MSLIPHICDRIDCEHNYTGTHTGTHFCVFFSGYSYFLDCLRNGTMYQPKQSPTENSQIDPEIPNIIDEYFLDMIYDR